MEINVLEEKKNRLVLEVKGEGHGLCNLLNKAVWKDKSTNIAGYSIDHPLSGVPRVIVETDGKKAPKDVLKGAIKNLRKECDEFQKAFEKTVK